MKKLEFIQNVVAIGKENDLKLTQDIANRMLDVVEAAIDDVILSGEHVTVMGMKFDSKVQKGRTGTINIGNRKGETYSTPDRIVPSVKFLGSKKESLSREAK